MLPGNPLHHLLLRALDAPVVATSGNLSEEPLCTDEHEALARLAGLADLFLVHDRPILRHVDDSIVREIAGRELVLRRARGFAPLPISVDHDLPRTLAVGGHQKNTVAIAVGSQIFLSQHIGDLESAESQRAFESVTAAMQSLYDFKPQTIACDLHPDYASTQYAERTGIPVERVQHHAAHVLACMAENRIRPPVLGIAWDGSGMGGDGTVWGGEFLHVTDASIRRVAHLRPFRLPGNEKAVREPRRVALAILYEIFGEDVVHLESPALRAFTPTELNALVTMLRRRVNAPVTSSAGRLFDAFASLTGLRQVASFEGQAAMALENALVGTNEEQAYPFRTAAADDGLVLDWEPAVRALLTEPTTPAFASARFHAMLVAMAVDVAKRVGEKNVVLSGGCFQNRVLTEGMICGLGSEGYRPIWHQRVPPSDGGLALGQIMAAERRKD
jgi:hydrogenase maturation protein HypF